MTGVPDLNTPTSMRASLLTTGRTRRSLMAGGIGATLVLLDGARPTNAFQEGERHVLGIHPHPDAHVNDVETKLLPVLISDNAARTS